MKIKCQNCNKKFDYQEKMGLCPSCGRYIKLSQQAPKGREAKSWEDSGYLEEEVPSLDRDSKLNTSKNRIIFHVLSFSILLLMAGYFLVIKFIIIPCQIDTIYQVQKDAEPEQLEVFYNDLFNIEGIDLKINEIRSFELEGIKEPEGWKYVQLPYSVYSDDIDYRVKDSIQFYLQVEGYYLPPLSKYDFPEYSQERSAGRLNLKADTVSDRFEESIDGKYVFLVPEDSEDYQISIYKKQVDKSNSKAVHQLECIYHVTQRGD